MRVLETDSWSLLLPPEWQAEQDEDGIVISDQDGVGTLEFSTMMTDDAIAGADEVSELAGAETPLAAVDLGGHAAWTHALVEEGSAIREWFLPAGRMLLYITYSCAEDNRGLDDAAVDEILATLSVTEMY